MARPITRQIKFNCDYCGIEAVIRTSHYTCNKRHFCSRGCYTAFRTDFLPKEEHNRFGKGNSPEEKKKKVKARSDLNHALRDGLLKRLPCLKCGRPAEAHHDDYEKPLEVRWLCFKHHREHHKLIYESPELMKNKV